MAAGAASTFMGLMTQLQSMELQLTSVLMESMMKIATMIDANVFVMVESSGQRYFAGKKYLCDSYLNSGLNPSGNDIELEIFPEVCALQEKVRAPEPFSPGGSVPPQQTAYPETGNYSMPPGGGAGSSGQKRARKRPSPSPVTINIPSSSTTTLVQVSPKRLRTEIAEAINVKTERKTEAEELDDVTVIEDDDEVDDSMSAVVDASFNDSMVPNEGGDYSTNEHMTVLNAILQHPKLEAVQQVCDSTIADKDSVASKLLNSLLYEYAKIAAHHCPFDTIDDPRCKAFYSQCFEELWNHLPNLQELHDKGLMIRRGTAQRYSVRALLRKWFMKNSRECQLSLAKKIATLEQSTI